MKRCFAQSQLVAIAAALADTTSVGLTGYEIGYLLGTCGLSDPTPTMTKRNRLCKSIAESQNGCQYRRAILAIIRNAMKPERFARCPKRFEPMRTILNIPNELTWRRFSNGSMAIPISTTRH